MKKVKLLSSKTLDNRMSSIDHFRGLAILLMVLANFMADKIIIPAWLKHAPDIGYTIIDLIAPMFIFAIGLTYKNSFDHRLERDGASATYGHFFRRYMVLIGIGTIFATGEIMLDMAGGKAAWGVLQAIGAAGILTMLVIRFHWSIRLVIAILMLAGYQVMLDHVWLNSVLHSSHGGMLGALNWASMLILSTTLADLINLNKKKGLRIIVIGLAVLAIGLILITTGLSTISKNRVSSSYVLVSVGLSVLIYGIFYWLNTLTAVRLPILSDWGMNPLLLYVLHEFLLGIIVLPGIYSWGAGARLSLVILQALGLIAILQMIANALTSRKIIVSL